MVRTEALVRVRYEETDQTRVVYHANYLRYFEVGRVELLRARGIRYRDVEDSGVRLPVVETRLSFRAPARFDDLLVVTCEVARLRPTRLDLRYTIRRKDEPDRLCVEGMTVLASVGTDLKPCRLPENIRRALSVSEAGEESQ